MSVTTLLRQRRAAHIRSIRHHRIEDVAMLYRHGRSWLYVTDLLSVWLNVPLAEAERVLGNYIEMGELP